MNLLTWLDSLKKDFNSVTLFGAGPSVIAFTLLGWT